MVILLSREYGSGGRVIGEEVAKRLGYSFYDKEMIVKVAEETGLAQSYVKEHSEHSKGSSIFAYAFSPRDEAGVSLEDTLMNAQTKVIKKIAEEENAVIVGRCADYVLRDKKDKLTVFIYGNEPEKIERISKLRNISKEETLKFIKEMDKRVLTISTTPTRNGVTERIMILCLILRCLVMRKLSILSVTWQK